MKDWPLITSSDLNSLNEITLVLHLASQFVGAAGKCLIAPEPDYSHTSMTWDAERGWFIGKKLPAKQSLEIALNVDGMVLLLIDQHKHILSSFELISETFDDGIKWLRVVLGDFAVDTRDYVIEMEDDIPDHPVRHGKEFPLFSPEEFASFIRVRTLGDKVMKHYAAQYEHASPVETWPHHFDVGTYIPLKMKNDEASHSISLGMAVKDAYVDEHYFYVTHWKKEGEINYDDLPKLPAGGYWNQKNFVGAILKMSDLVNQNPDQASQRNAILSFMEKSISASKSLLQL